MNEDEEILESLIAGGMIGAALGALISNDKSGTGLGALAGSVLLATYTANKNAQKTKVPLVLEEKGILYEMQADGSRRIIRKLVKPSKKVPKKFRLT